MLLQLLFSCYDIYSNHFKLNILTFQDVICKGTLSIQLIDYKNPSHRNYAGTCCDPGLWFLSWCPNECENFLRNFRLVSYPAASWKDTWKKWTTYVCVRDDSNFPGYGSSLGPGFNNPLTYHFDDAWPVRILSFHTYPYTYICIYLYT